jgi:hypothetical protein
MKTERSILIFASLSILAIAIFTSYNTPQSADPGSETAYLIDIVIYKKEVADKILTDKRRMEALNARLEIEKSESRNDHEDDLAMLKAKINAMQTTMNNYEGNGPEEWELFREKFDRDLNELHESLINLMTKTSNSLHSDLSPSL